VVASTVGLTLLLLLTGSCGGGSASNASTSVSGAYEFVVTSTVTGGVTLIEANLSASGDQSTANGAGEVQVLTFEKKIWYVNGICPGNSPGQNNVAVNLGNNNDVALTFDEGGNTLPGQGVLVGATINGNYAVSGSNCPDLVGVVGFPPGTDSGGIVGNQVPNLSGTFAGSLTLPNGPDDAALTLTENTDHTLTVSAALTGQVDNGTFTLTGTAVGNIMFVSGTISGQTVDLFGYYDRSGAYTKMPNSLLVFDYDLGSSDGLLLGQ